MDQALLDEGYRCYTGEKIDVYFNTAICQHSGNCVRGVTNGAIVIHTQRLKSDPGGNLLS